jgi:NAD(P)-dependent dehydrogenase (short-subunit alcohol dehydrogenase family)
MEKCLSNKRSIITGGSRGLGLEVAKKFIASGSHVLISSRSKDELVEASDVLRSMAEVNQKILHKVADVSKESEVKSLVEFSIAELGGCDVLVNNAGVYGPMGCIEDIDWLEWINAININLLGSVLMCKYLVPVFKDQKYGKIIQISGGGATKPIPYISAYAASKAGIVRFAETLAHELFEFGIKVNSIAPGPLNTGMLDEVLSAGPEKVGKFFYEQSIKQMHSGGASLNLAADLAVFLAAKSGDGITGKLISAVWDDWPDFPNHLAELGGSDVYTLKRINAKDRGFTWGDK